MKTVFFGDSIAWGFSANCRENSYAELFCELFYRATGRKTECVNRSIGGNVLTPLCPEYKKSVGSPAVERVDNDVISLLPDLTVCAFGANDLRGGTDPCLFVDEYKRMLSRLTALTRTRVVVMGMCYMCADSFGYYPTFRHGDEALFCEYNNCIKDLSDALELPFCDLLSATDRHDNYFDSDMLHPNTLGHIVIASELLKTVMNTYYNSGRTISETKAYIKKYTNGFRENN